jgi:D-alanyl-D-alanine carboxypeptidase/D-alanyl-D-alanine-endopeptidase (penicillin-binding protein 4)
LILLAPAGLADPPRKARSAIPAPPRGKPTKPLTRGDGPLSHPTVREALREELREVLGHRALARGTTAVHAVDAETGEVLFSVHADKRLNPASNVKLFSTAAVLDVLGADYRYRTRLIGATPDHAGHLEGDIFLLGSADPTFHYYEAKALVADLAARGVKKIAGDVVLSDDRYRDNLALPRIRVEVTGSRPGHKPSVRTIPALDFVELEVTARSTRRRRARPRIASKVIEVEGEARWKITVAGQARAHAKRVVRVAAPLPSTFTAHVLRALLIEAGIEVGGTIKIEGFSAFIARSAAAGRLPVELAEYQSAPMSDLVRMVNKRSINWLSDRLIMSAAAHERGGPLSMSSALDTLRGFLRRVGINPEKLRIDTGSGLSYNTELTARQIVKILRLGGGYEQGFRGDTSAFLRSLAIGGVDGTLARRLRGSPATGHVRGKTGTLTSCLALSGFVTAEGGRTVAFAIVTNGNRRRDRIRVRQEQDLLVESMHRFSIATRSIPAAIDSAPAIAADGNSAEPGESADVAAQAAP